MLIMFMVGGWFYGTAREKIFVLHRKILCGENCPRGKLFLRKLLLIEKNNR